MGLANSKIRTKLFDESNKITNFSEQWKSNILSTLPLNKPSLPALLLICWLNPFFSAKLDLFYRIVWATSEVFFYWLSLWECFWCVEEKFPQEMDGWLISPSFQKYSILVFLDNLLPECPSAKLHPLHFSLAHPDLPLHHSHPPITIKSPRRPHDEPKIIENPGVPKKNMELMGCAWFLPRICRICDRAHFPQFHYDRHERSLGVF